MTAIPPAVRPLGRALFGLALVVYLSFAGGSLTSTDAVVTFDVTRSIVERGSVAMSGNLLGMDWHRGRGGEYYAPFGIGQSIWNIAPYLAATAVMRATGWRLGRPDTLQKAAVALSQTVVAAAVVWATFMLGVVATGAPRAAALGALTLAFGSVLWPYAGFGFNQPLAALTLTLGLLDAIAGAFDGDRRRLGRSGWWLAASVLTRHEMALAVPPILVWLWFGPAARTERVERVGLLVPGLAAGAAAWMALNWWRFGSVFEMGYLRDPVPGIGSPFFEGLAGLLVSPSTSLLLYSPFAAAGILGVLGMTRTRDRSIALLLLAEIVLFVVFYAMLGNWTGGRSYGSRYLLVTLPLAAVGWAWALAGLRDPIRGRLFAAVFLAGLAIQLPGVLVDYAKVSQSAGRAWTTEERQWSFEAAPIVANARALVRAVPDNAAYVLGRRQPPPVPATAGPGDRSFSQQFAFSLDVWWLYLFYLAVLPRLGLLAIVASAAAAIAIGARAVRVRGLEFDA